MFSDDRPRHTTARHTAARRAALCAMYAAGALMLSFAEALLPPLPIPGAKLGLANLAILLCFCHMGPGWGTAAAFVRWSLVGMLFGSGTSLLFSLSGMICMLGTLGLLRSVGPGRRMSFLGLSVLSAAAHNLGQLFCGALLYGWGMAVLSMYGGWLLLLGTGCGVLTGIAANLLAGRLRRFFNNSLQ